MSRVGRAISCLFATKIELGRSRIPQNLASPGPASLAAASAPVGSVQGEPPTAQQWEYPTLVAGVDGGLCTGLGAITSVAD